MLAGRDTTAATLTFVMYFLASYPAVCTRLREEILAKVGSTRRPDYDDIRDMKYLRAVINGKRISTFYTSFSLLMSLSQKRSDYTPLCMLNRWA